MTFTLLLHYNNVAKTHAGLPMTLFIKKKKPFFFLVLQYSHLIVLLTSLLVLYEIKEELRK